MKPTPPNNSHGQPPPESAHPDPIAPVSEKQLARLWERRAARQREFYSETGGRIRVLYPGRPGVTAGPDFRDALLMVEGQGLVRGDVEVHLRQRDWYSHGHHRDPNYNGVVLHLALQSDPQPSITNSGAAPPLVNLSDLLNQTRDPNADLDDTRSRLWQILARHGYRRPQRPEQMAALLNRAGDQRFLAHSDRFQLLLAAQPPEQTLWESICDALGYRHNRHPFLMLANAAPCALLSDAARRLPANRREDTVARWLLCLAGFETGPVPPDLGPPLETSDWRLFRVRPANHPRRRILGAAALLARFCESGFIPGIAAAAAADPKTLTRSLTVPGADAKPGPIGPTRARDIAVNVALPFLHAWRASAGHQTAARHTLDLYRRYGPLSDNEITRQLPAALYPPEWGRIAKDARRQQGLLHLQRLLAGATVQP